MSTDDLHDDLRDDDEQHRLRNRVEGLFRDVLRKTVSSGMSTALQTEESLRNIVGEIKLPREVVGYLLQQIDNTKRELVQIAAREFREFLESANIGEELTKILTTLSFEIRTEVRFIPNDQALKPNVSSRISVRNRASGETISEDDAVGPLDEAIRDAASDLAGRFIRPKQGQDAKSGTTRKPDPAKAASTSEPSGKGARESTPQKAEIRPADRDEDDSKGRAPSAESKAPRAATGSKPSRPTSASSRARSRKKSTSTASSPKSGKS